MRYRTLMESLRDLLDYEVRVREQFPNFSDQTIRDIALRDMAFDERAELARELATKDA